MDVVTMDIRISPVEGTNVVIVEGPDVIIRNVQDALDLMASVRYAHGCNKAVLDKAVISEDFFRLRTGLAGEILQKFTNYRFVIAIFGDFEGYDSKSLRDFIYESNQGKQAFFTRDKESAVDRLRNL